MTVEPTDAIRQLAEAGGKFWPFRVFDAHGTRLKNKTPLPGLPDGWTFPDLLSGAVAGWPVERPLPDGARLAICPSSAGLLVLDWDEDRPIPAVVERLFDSLDREAGAPATVRLKTRGPGENREHIFLRWPGGWPVKWRGSKGRMVAQPKWRAAYSTAPIAAGNDIRCEGWIVLHDPAAAARALALPAVEAAQDVVAALITERVPEGGRHEATLHRGNKGLLSERANRLAAILDGVDERKAAADAQDAVDWHDAHGGHADAGAAGAVHVGRDGAVARAFRDYLDGRGRWIVERKTWIVWQDGRGWSRGGQAEIDLSLHYDAFITELSAGGAAIVPGDKDALDYLDKDAKKRAVLAWLKARSGVPVSIEDCGKVPGVVGLPLGMALDARRGADPMVREARREELIIRTLTVAPDFDAEPATFLAFIEGAMPDAEVREWFRGWCRWMLDSSMRGHHLALFLVGLGGTGKGTLVELLAALMGNVDGAGYGAGVRADNFGNKGDSASAWQARLEGALFAAIEELPNKAIAVARVKRLVGSRQTARGMREADKDFDATAALLFTANDLPKVETRDPGWERRQRIIRLDHRPENENVNILADMKAELPGVLAWIMGGDSGVVAEGREPAVMKRWQAAALANVDDLAETLKAAGFKVSDIREGPEGEAFGMVEFQDVRRRLALAESGGDVGARSEWFEVSDQKFGLDLRRAGFQTKRRKVGGKLQTFVIGLRVDEAMKREAGGELF